MNVHELTLQNYSAASGCPSACQPALYLGTAGSYGNEQINVVLGEGWQGLTVKAVFQPSGVPVVVPDGGGVISVPWEATQSVIAYPKGRISFQGYASGRLVNTSDVSYTVGGSSAGTDNTPAPTPDEFQQFVDAVKADADRAEQAAADAEAAVQKVTNAGTQAVTDIGNAKDSALEAIAAAREEAAGSISADVEGAKQAAADAEQSAADAEQSAKDAADALANVQAAGKSALDDIATERQNTLSDIQNEGAKQQSAVAGAGTAALEAIGQTEQAAINQIKQTGETQVGAVQSAGTTQISQINSAGAAQVQAVKDEGATQVQAVKDEGAAQTSALDDAAAAHKTELEGIASHPPQPNTETGKWQVWNAETGAYQDTDALYQGGYYTPTVSDDGVLTWQGSLPDMPAIPSANIKGPKGDKGDPGLGVPTPTTSDAGKVPTVKADGSAYELAGPYAPLSATIRPTANGNPVNITDSVEWPLLGLKVYGKSTQDGTPSPESPVPIVSAGDEGSIGLTISDGADQSQQLTISTPNGLPGIPVDSGGNYTDAEGQQWVCDEIDFARGVYVQRVVLLEFDGSSDEQISRVTTGVQVTPVFRLLIDPTIFVPNDINGLSNQFIAQTSIRADFEWQNGNIWTKSRYFGNALAVRADEFSSEQAFKEHLSTHSLKIMINAATPIETPIPPEELAAYRDLHTYDGTTVVSAAEDVAGLEVKYLADGEKYVERIVSQKAPEAAAAHTMALLADGIREGVNGV